MFETASDAVLTLLVLLLGGLLCLLIGKSINVRPAMSLTLYVWHATLCYFYSSFVLMRGGDSFTYFQRARFEFIELNFGTEFIVWLSSIPVSVGFGFWALSFAYHVTGAVGLLFFYATLRDASGDWQRSIPVRLLTLLCCFLPSLSFWTSGIGKDSFSFLSVGLFLWSTGNFGRRQLAAIIAILLMLAVRPHMAALMVLSVAAGTVFVAEVRGTTRFSAGAIATAGAVFAIPLALAYSGSNQFPSIAEFISDRQEQNMGGGSSIDITGMNPVLRLLSFLYRPLPNEASGLDQLAASLENVFLIVLTLAGLFYMYRAGFIAVFRRYSISLLYGLGSLVLLSQVTANLGLATRQKWMLVPALMLVILGAWSMAREASAKTLRHRPYASPPARAER